MSGRIRFGITFPLHRQYDPWPKVVERVERYVALLSEEARALGRDPGAIGRVFLAGFSPGTEAPWASVAALEDIVGRYRGLGFAEFVFPEPVADEWTRFERTSGEVLPRLSYP